MPKEKNLKGKDIESEVQSVRNLFCTNLKRLREDVVLSQNMLAKKAGLTANFINDLENGKKGPLIKQ
uniref:HTH cro/C1-type domain-containing protein n=1 Tax=uncultured bacterium contig00063 TaxID=1181546 RepID=A0A806JZP5_9BACT|nr:hypothetical protein [uncultured bacterium contig00063]